MKKTINIEGMVCGNCVMHVKNVLEADISIRDEEKTEKGKFVAKAKDILMSKSEKEVKYLVKVLECAADNLNQVSGN